MRLIDAEELRLSHCLECTLYPNNCLKDNCDWDSIYHIEHSKTIEAIPIEWLENYLANKTTGANKAGNGYFYKRFIKNWVKEMLKSWRQENEIGGKE